MPKSAFPLLLSALALLATPALTAQSYTSTYGYTKVTVPGGQLAAVSAGLKAPAALNADAVVNADYSAGAGTQTVTVAGAAWTTSPSQWAEPGGTQNLCYVTDSNGGEEAFLITAHTADTLTISTSFDLQSPSRAIPDGPATTTITIRAAQTIGGLFGVGTETAFTSVDKVYLWNGAGWTTYTYINGWRKAGVGGTHEGDIIFPDEGLFISREDPSDLVLTFLGTVPGKAQVSTIPGPGTLMVASRYPVDTTISQLGLETLPGWQTGTGGDLVYRWNGAGWDTYFYVSGWRKAGQGGTVPNEPIPANSALFISRVGTATSEESGNLHLLPYTP